MNRHLSFPVSLLPGGVSSEKLSQQGQALPAPQGLAPAALRVLGRRPGVPTRRNGAVLHSAFRGFGYLQDGPPSSQDPFFFFLFFFAFE